LFGRQADRVEENRGDVDFSKTNALLVDGNGATRRTVREDLLSWGCSPEEAKSGREALERLESRRRGDDKCFLVITDMRLPDMSGFDLARKVREMDEYSQIPIVLLTSMGTRGDAKLCREIGIQAYLTRPLDPGDLYRAVNAVLSRPVVNGSDSRLVTRHTIAEEGIKGAIVLVAEDNPTNRQVVERHLSSAGYHVNLAEDGRKAVELYGERQYDLVLMDVQMPEMDGYEASRAIREIEARLAASAGAGGLPRTPLIAVTAHATKEHRERCFACGMDDYVCKPLKRRELLQVVEKWLKNDQEPVLAPAQERDCKCDKPIDYDKALDEFEGDEEFLSEVVAGFLDNLKLQARAIRKAIEARDAETVQREGHSIKGGAGNLAAEPLSHIGYELEMIGKSGELPAGKDALDRLELEAGRLETYLRQRVN
jgi:CheY-like chemotaxis protein/HPt (histidine-containing phosphotransfer) domain-containing protein